MCWQEEFHSNSMYILPEIPVRMFSTREDDHRISTR